MATAPNVPAEMKAAAIDKFGPPDLVHTETLPVPRPAKNEVLIDVVTAGVGEWDPELIDGTLQMGKVRFPHVFGSDGAGTVVAIGNAVTRVAIGDRVYGWGLSSPKGGFFAEYAAIPERDVARIPEAVAFEEAGALAVSGITALQGLEYLDLEPRQNLMIFGASGGVGHIALQLAKRFGLRVFAIASKPDGMQLALRLGADRVVDGHRGFVQQGRAFAPDGFDGALVFAGGIGWKDALRLVNTGSRVAWPNGVEPEPRVPVGVERVPYDAEHNARAFDHLNAVIGQGPLHVELSKTYSLDETARALKEVRQHHIGKLAIKIG